jgi:hypothetical protein
VTTINRVLVTFPGPQGAAGPQGTNGNSVRHGSGAPSTSLGIDGDFYLDTANGLFYGPKASGIWPSIGLAVVGYTKPTTGIPRTDLANDVQADLTRTKGYVSWGEMAGTKTWQEIYDNNLTWAQAANMTWGEFFGLTTWQRVYDAYVSWDQASSNNWGAL